MNRNTILYAQLVAVTALVILDLYFGFEKSYYWYYPWFDTVTHLVGGLWAGFFSAWILMLLGKGRSLVYCVAIVFAIGVAWELFEAIAGLTIYPSDTLDTVKDLCNDVIGGSIAAYISTRGTRT